MSNKSVYWHLIYVERSYRKVVKKEERQKKFGHVISLQNLSV